MGTQRSTHTALASIVLLKTLGPPARAQKPSSCLTAHLPIFRCRIYLTSTPCTDFWHKLTLEPGEKLNFWKKIKIAN